MTSRHYLLTSTVLATLVVTAIAEQNQVAPEPPPIASQNVSSLIVGEFSGDTENDAVVLADGAPVLRDTVEAFETYLAANVLGVDIAALRGKGTGGRDQVILVGSDGLSRLEFQSGNGWSVTNLRGPTTKWASAIAVRCGDVDGIHGADIVGVTPSRILIATADGVNGWNVDTQFTAGAAITGLELLDWDGNDGGAKEIAICGNWGIAIWEANGTLLDHFTWGLGPVLIQPLGDPGLGRDRLASVAKTTGTNEQALSVFTSAELMEGPWSLGTIGVVQLAGGDWTGDGFDDLVLNSTSSAKARILRHRGNGGGALLDTETLVEVSIGNPSRPTAVQDGDLDLIDVDHDGDADIVSAVQGTFSSGSITFADPRFSGVEIGRNPRIDQRSWMPWRRSEDSWPYPVPYPTHDTLTGTITVSFKAPDVVIPGAQFEFAVWRTPHKYAQAIAVPIVPWSVIGVASSPGTWETTTLDLDQHDDLYPDRYTLIGRQVRRDASGTIVEESPALRLTLYSEASLATMTTFFQVLSTDPVLNLIKPEDPGGSSSGPGLPPTGPNQRP